MTPAGTDLDQDARRGLRAKARHAVLAALVELGGEGVRAEVLARAGELGGFTERELAAPPPAKANPQHTGLVGYELSWALSTLKRDGRLETPTRGVWRLAGTGAAPVSTAAERAALVASLPYEEYVLTPEWRQRRAEAIERAGHACMADAAHTHGLEVHHRSHERRGHELEADLVVLCAACSGRDADVGRVDLLLRARPARERQRRRGADVTERLKVGAVLPQDRQRALGVKWLPVAGHDPVSALDKRL